MHRAESGRVGANRAPGISDSAFVEIVDSDVNESEQTWRQQWKPSLAGPATPYRKGRTESRQVSDFPAGQGRVRHPGPARAGNHGHAGNHRGAADAAYVKGVINLRGKVIPVVDLRLKFGMPEIEYTQRTCIIVVQIRCGRSC